MSTPTPRTTPRTISRSYLHKLYEVNKESVIAAYMPVVIQNVERLAKNGSTYCNHFVDKSFTVSGCKIKIEDLLPSLRATFPDSKVEQAENNKECIVIDWS